MLTGGNWTETVFWRLFALDCLQMSINWVSRQVIQGKNKFKIGFAVVVFFSLFFTKMKKRWGDTQDDPFLRKRCISLPPTCKAATRISAQQLKTFYRADDPSKLGRCEAGRAQTHGKQSHHIKPKATWRRGGDLGEWSLQVKVLVGHLGRLNPVCLQKQLWRQGEETRLTRVSKFADKATNVQTPDLQGAQSELLRGLGRFALSQVSIPRLLSQRRTAWGQVGRSSPPVGWLRRGERPVGGWAVLNSCVAACVGGASGGRSRWRRGVLVTGLVLLLLVEAQADVALQGRWGQPLLGQAALEEGNAGAEVGQSVDPAGNLPSTQQLREEWQDVLSSEPTESFVFTLYKLRDPFDISACIKLLKFYGTSSI